MNKELKPLELYTVAMSYSVPMQAYFTLAAVDAADAERIVRETMKDNKDVNIVSLHKTSNCKELAEQIMEHHPDLNNGDQDDN